MSEAAAEQGNDLDQKTHTESAAKDSVEKIVNSLRMRLSRSNIEQSQKVAVLLIEAFCEHKCKIEEKEVIRRKIKFKTDYKTWRFHLETKGFIVNHIVTNESGRMVRQWISAGRTMGEFVLRYNTLKEEISVSQHQFDEFKKEVWENDVNVRDKLEFAEKKVGDLENRLSEVEKVIEALIEIFDPPGHPSKTRAWIANPQKIKQYVNIEVFKGFQSQLLRQTSAPS